MYISRLCLNPKSRQVMKEIRSPYEMHRTLSKAFIFDDNLQPERLLFRVEPEMERFVCVLVQSHQSPDWSKLTVNTSYFYSYPNNAIAVKTFDPVLPQNAMYSFRLRANPSKKDMQTKKRVGLKKDEEIFSWLYRKAAESGFEALIVEFRKEQDFVSYIKTNERLSEGTHSSVLFQGVLKVTDPGIFAETLKGGIGSAKGFGFGLLSIAPLRSD